MKKPPHSERPPAPHPARARASSEDRRRYDLVLGIDLGVASGFAVVFAVSVTMGGLPAGSLLFAWLGLLSIPVVITAGAVTLRGMGRIAGATALLTALAAPAGMIGLALVPLSLASLVSGAANPVAFGAWLGPDIGDRAVEWLTMFALLGAIIPLGLVSRRFGRHFIARGVMLGVGVVASLLLFAIAGGFLFRHAR